MEKLKDFLYDKNDILVALIIVLIAGLIITSRINVIMTYPQKLVADKQGNVIESDLTKNKHDGGEDSSTDSGNKSNSIEGAPDISTGIDKDEKSSTGAKTTGSAVDKNSKTGAPHSLYISYGSSTTKIADDLVNGKILKDKNEFLNAVTAAGAENKLKAGNFVIPADATAAEIVAIITK